jgi:hypothetical protein
LQDSAETVHLAGIVYALPGAGAASLRSLRRAAAGDKGHQLRAAFEHLLGQVLAAWHKRGETLSGGGPMALYRRQIDLAGDGLSRDRLERGLQALIEAVRARGPLDVRREGGKLVMSLPQAAPLVCTDPLLLLYDDGLMDDSVVCRISPGRLAADNVLIDGHGRAWPSDFAAAGQAPQWWDFVCLEAVVRFDLGHAPDLEAWDQFEAALAAPDSLDHSPRETDVIPELQTNVRLIAQIRRQACLETGQDAWPYYAGLLAWAFAAIAPYDPGAIYTPAEHLRAGHLLLALGHLGRRLGDLEPAPIATPPPDDDHPLRLDEDGVRVWLAPGRAVSLAGQALCLFRSLYQRAGRVVSRDDLVAAVFDETYTIENRKYLDHRLNTVVHRLREEIEPFPQNPRYLLTVRGQGYRLDRNGGRPDPGEG